MLLIQGISCEDKEEFMKKRLIFVLVLMMCACVMLVACDNNNGDKGSENDGMLFYGREKGLTEGAFTEDTTPQEICDKISEGNYTILFTDNNYNDDYGRSGSEMIKFAKDYVALVSTAVVIYDEDPDNIYNETYLNYYYYLNEQDVIYRVSADIVVYPEYKLDDTEAHELSSVIDHHYSNDFYLEDKEKEFAPKDVICNLIMSGNYTIVNGNIKLINPDKSLYFYGVDWYTYFNNATIFNVGTTEATLIDECKNWRELLNAQE